MSGLERLFDHVTVARKIISRLTDWDVRQLCRDPYWSILNVLPGKFWRDRARKNYVNSESEILLANNFEIFGFYDYVNFIITVDSIRRCDTKAQIRSFLTNSLPNGPGTEPILHSRTSHSSSHISWSSTMNTTVIMNTQK